MSRAWESYFSANHPRVMGVINLTPDSFFPASRSDAGHQAELLQRVRAMVAQGADILDLGAESSRPGADEVSEDEELQRLLPAVELARSHCDLPISIDTRRASVARKALAAGADIINDISSGRDGDRSMFDLAAGAGVPLVLMHMQGQPRHMQDSPAYRDVVREVLDFLSERAAAARAAGVRQLIVDPGIGFGKTTGHNLQLLAAIDRFRGLGWPVLVGHSRKNFIGQVLASPGASGLAEPRPVDGRLAGGLGVAVWCALQGAAIIRTHDVAETCDALTLVAAIQAQRGEAVHV